MRELAQGIRDKLHSLLKQDDKILVLNKGRLALFTHGTRESFCRVVWYFSRRVILSHTLKCLSFGTPNTTTFPFAPNGKRWLLGVPI